MSGLGDEIDPAMMSALMATTALVAAGASNEEVSTVGTTFPYFLFASSFIFKMMLKRSKNSEILIPIVFFKLELISKFQGMFHLTKSLVLEFRIG